MITIPAIETMGEAGTGMQMDVPDRHVLEPPAHDEIQQMRILENAPRHLASPNSGASPSCPVRGPVTSGRPPFFFGRNNNIQRPGPSDEGFPMIQTVILHGSTILVSHSVQVHSARIVIIVCYFLSVRVNFCTAQHFLPCLISASDMGIIRRSPACCPARWPFHEPPVLNWHDVQFQGL